MAPDFSAKNFDPHLVTNWCADDDARAASLLHGLQSPDPEIRTRALNAYRGAMDQIAIKSEAAVLLTAELTADPSPEIRQLARQTLIEIDNRDSAAPALSKLIETLRLCTDFTEAADLGRVIGAIRVPAKHPESPIDKLIDVLGSGTDAARAGAARAAGGIAMFRRQWLSGSLRKFENLENDAVALMSGEELGNRLRDLNIQSGGKLFRSSAQDLGQITTEYSAALQLLPALAQNLGSKSASVLDTVTFAVKQFEADALSVMPQLAPIFRHEDTDVRANALEAWSYCRRHVRANGELLAELLETERGVVGLLSVIRAARFLDFISPRAMLAIRHFAGLPPNEDELQRKAPLGSLVIGNSIVSSAAQQTLRDLEARVQSN